MREDGTRWLADPLEVTPKHPDRSTILHISDFHFTADTDYERTPFRQLLTEVHGRRADIDLVLCTGDLIDGAVTDTWLYNTCDVAIEKAKQFLLRICRECEVDPKRGLFVVPGNHDYRVKGILPWSSLKKLFATHLQEYFRSALLPALNLLIASFDSNATDPRPSFATGLVEQEEFDQLVRWIDAVKEVPGFDECIRLAVLHHHPMPIAETESRKTTEAVEFQILKNAANFMREAIKAEIDLILHGHQHFIGYSYASFPSPETTRQVAVVAAGSAGKLYNGIHAYNLVTIPRQSQVTVQQRVLANGSFDRSINFEVPTEYSEWRRTQAQRLARHPEVVTRGRLHASELEIDSYGDVRRLTTYHELRSRDGELKSIPLRVFSEIPQFDTPEVSCVNVQSQRVEVRPVTAIGANQPVADPKQKQKLYEMRFDPALRSDKPLDIQLTQKAFSSFVFYAEDRAENEPETVGGTLRGYYDALRLLVRFDHPNAIQALRVRVRDQNGSDNEIEREYCERLLSYSEETRTAQLALENPLPRHRYEIIWNLPDKPDSDLEPADRLANQALREKLANCSTQPALREAFVAGLNDMGEQIAMAFGLTAAEDKPALAMLRFDQSDRRLKTAFGLYPPGHPIYGFSVLKGEGIEGQALTRNAVLATIVQDEVWERFYVNPAADGSGERETMLLAVPVAYPINSDLGVAVFRLAATSLTTPLVALDQAGRAKLAEIVVRCYVARVLPLAGIRPPLRGTRGRQGYPRSGRGAPR